MVAFEKTDSGLTTYGVFIVTGLVFLVYVDAFDLIYEITRSHESWNLDEFLLCLPLLLLCVTSFSILRVFELKRQRADLLTSKDQLANAYERLEDLSRYREKFVFRACHELKHPIASAAEHIRRLGPKIEPRDRPSIVDATNSLENLLCFMDDLAACTQEEANRTDGPHSLNIQSLLESVRLLYQNQADTKRLSLHVTRANIPNTVVCSARYLRLVLLALVGNAIKHTDSGRVSVHCRLNERDASSMLLTVSDTGKGLAEADVERLFVPKNNGNLPSCLNDCMGIGLPFVYRLIKENGGNISVTSSPGEGTEFLLTIPVSP